MPSEDVKWPKRLPPLITFSTWFFSTNTSHLGALAESMVVQTPDGFAKKPRTVRSLLGFILSFFLHRLGPFESSEALQVPSNSNSCKFSVLSAWSRQHHADRSCNGISLKMLNAPGQRLVVRSTRHARARAHVHGEVGQCRVAELGGGSCRVTNPARKMEEMRHPSQVEQKVVSFTVELRGGWGMQNGCGLLL